MLSSTRVLVRLPSQTILSKASYSTAKVAAPKPAAPAWKPLPPKPAPAISKPPPPSKQPKKDTDILNDDIIVDTTPILTSTIPVQPINTPIQPFAKKPAPISRVVPPRPAPTATPFAPRPPTPTTVTPSSPSIPSIPTFPSISEISTFPPAPTPTPTPTPTATLATPVPPPAPAPATAKPKAKPKKAAAPKAANATNAVNASANAGNAKHAPTHAERAALSRDLAGRSPQQLLTQIAQLQQHNATLQSQLVYHSAVDAIYGETGFNQFRNLISEFSEEEALALKTSGFEGDSIIHHLEVKQRELCLQFTQTMGAELSKHVTSNVKRLKDQHRQSASAATATQQTLRNAGVPDAIISSTLTGLQPHLDELQIKIVRWEKLKADIDLLLATYSANH